MTYSQKAANTPTLKPVEASDLIRGAIERHRAAFVAFNVACVATDSVAANQSSRLVTADDEAEYASADREEVSAFEALASCAPRTLGDLRALLAYLVSVPDYYEDPDRLAWVVAEIAESLAA